MYTLQRSTRIAICCCAAVLAGCAKKDEAPVDTTAMTTTSASTTTVAPAAVNLADVAGKWNVSAVPTTGKDTSATKYVLTATGTTDGWTITFPGRKPMAVKVRTDADSIMIDSDKYQSVRRKGVTVTTNSVVRLQGGNLSGGTTAHYSVKTADSVLTLTITGTRAK